jgi:hypothetical protein
MVAVNRLMVAVWLTSALLVGAHAVAAQPVSQAALFKHQLSDCMSRRMGADRTLSYNDAMRTCKDRLQPTKEALASNSPGDSGTKAH